jgi:hypothetical protein
MAAFIAGQSGNWTSGTTWAPQVVDGGFELPALSANTWAVWQGTSPWTGSGTYHANGSGGFNGSPDSGSQFAVIRTTGSLSQTVVFRSASYTLNLRVRWRTQAEGGPATNINTLDIKVDGSTVGTVTPTNTWTTYNVSLGTLSGSKTIAIVGTAGTGENDTFVDTVSLSGNPGDFPASGDTATIRSPSSVTVDANSAVGNSPAEGNNVLTVESGASLTVGNGFALTVKGDISNSGTMQVGEAGGGGTLEFDASAASSPSTTNYKHAHGTTSAIFRTRGTTGSHSVVRSNSGGGNANFVDPGGSGGGVYDLQWCDFLRIGTASTESISYSYSVNPGSPTTYVTMADVTFTDCGRIHISSVGGANGGWSLSRVKCSGTLHASESLRILGTTPSGGVTRHIEDSAFDELLYLSLPGSTVTGTVMDGGFDHPGAGRWTEFSGNFIVGDNLTVRGSHEDCYFLCNAADNPHNPLPADTGQAEVADGFILEYSGPTFTIDAGNAYYGEGDWTLQNGIILPAANAPGSAMGAITFAAPDCKVIHCTLYSPSYGGGILMGDGGAVTDTYTEVKSNLFWVETALSNQVAVYANGTATTVDNVMTPGGCTHNGHVNMAANPYQGDYPTTQPGANDVEVGSVAPSSLFVAPYRNIGTWAVLRGSVGATYNDQAADGREYLLADPTLISSLIQHVRSGYAPKLLALRDAGHDGVTIGAVEFQASGVGSLVNGGLINSGLVNGGLVG